MVPPVSDRAPPTPPYSGTGSGSSSFRVRGCHPLRPAFPGVFPYKLSFLLSPALQPRARLDARGLGWSPFARRYSGSHSCFPLLRLLRCFSSAGSPPLRVGQPSAGRVAPFGHPRIIGRSRLPAAFRSLPRPSSPPGAKASPARPSLLVQRACARPAALPAGGTIEYPRSSFFQSDFLCFPSILSKIHVRRKPDQAWGGGREPPPLSRSARSPGQTRTADPHIISVVL